MLKVRHIIKWFINENNGKSERKEKHYKAVNNKKKQNKLPGGQSNVVNKHIYTQALNTREKK